MTDQVTEAEVQLGEQEAPEQQQEAKPNLTPEIREQRLTEKAKEQGWKDFSEHIEAGGDPEKWRPAGEFLLYGEMQDRIKSFEHGFENRAQRLEKYYKAQMKAQKEDLESRLEKAIDEGDSEAIRQANKQLREHEKLETENQAQPQQIPRELTAWNAKNTWINESSPKATHAKFTFAQAINAGKPVADALALVDAEIAKHFPSPRGSVPGSESGKGSKGFQKSNRALTWDDLTQEEIRAYNATQSAWKDKSQFLKAAKDARDAEEKENGR